MSDDDLDYHGLMYMWVHAHERPTPYAGDTLLSIQLEATVIRRNERCAPFHCELAKRRATFEQYIADVEALS